jgi:hypothetical protein
LVLKELYLAQSLGGSLFSQELTQQLPLLAADLVSILLLDNHKDSFCAYHSYISLIYAS